MQPYYQFIEDEVELDNKDIYSVNVPIPCVDPNEYSESSDDDLLPIYNTAPRSWMSDSSDSWDEKWRQRETTLADSDSDEL